MRYELNTLNEFSDILEFKNLFRNRIYFQVNNLFWNIQVSSVGRKIDVDVWKKLQ